MWRRSLHLRTVAVISIVCLAAVALETLSSAPVRVRLYRLLLFYPIIMFGSWILSRQDWNIERRLALLALALLPAAGVDLYVTSKIIAKADFHFVFYITNLVGYCLIVAVVFGLAVAAEKVCILCKRES